MKHFVILGILLSFLSMNTALDAKPILQPTLETKASYVVYASGFRVLSAVMTYREDIENNYQIILDTKTSGFLGWLVPWEGVFETQGVLKNQTYIPRLHYSSTIWDDEVETKTYTYNKDGTFSGLVIDATDKEREEKKIPAELADNTTDILSATMAAINSTNCDYRNDIFDGKRRYKVKYTNVENGTLENSKYNVFEGIAERCEVEIEPVAGRWHEKPRGWLSIQEQGRKKGSLPSFWYADPLLATKTPQGTENKQEKSIVFPVKVTVHTEYGTLVMNLEKISK